jgi:hypothetical protein
MRLQTHIATATSLFDAPVDHSTTVLQILFEEVRRECARLGLREGQTIRARESTDLHILLEFSDGWTATLARRWARFIEVEVEAGGSERAFSLIPRRGGSDDWSPIRILLDEVSPRGS